MGRLKNSDRKIRYAVVGLGHIAQAAVLPAFKHAGKNSELTALVSDDPKKRKVLSKKYGVAHTYSYAEYETCLRSGLVDAVYIALPNNQHQEYAVTAANNGVHILCEKPMAVTNEEGRAMIDAAKKNRVKLMVAYRLHFERANLEAIRIISSGKIGEPRIFNSVFSLQVRPGNIRTQRELGGGPLRDLGVYCINAARYIFRDEPIDVVASSATGRDPRFKEIEEMTGAVLRFPKDRLAAFTCSFGAADSGSYEVIGTKGSLRLSPAYEYAESLAYELTTGGKTIKKRFPKRDQFAPEIAYFSDCILSDKDPEPSGREGLNDTKIINAIFDSAKTRQAVLLNPKENEKHPTKKQEFNIPPVQKPDLVHSQSGSR